MHGESAPHPADGTRGDHDRHAATGGPTAVATEYFRRMRAGEPVADLFAVDAKVTGLGMKLDGREAVRAFYREAVTSGPKPDIIELAAQGATVFAEIVVNLDSGERVHVVDRFVIRDGEIAELTYFVAT